MDLAKWFNLDDKSKKWLLGIGWNFEIAFVTLKEDKRESLVFEGEEVNEGNASAVCSGRSNQIENIIVGIGWDKTWFLSKDSLMTYNWFLSSNR